MDSKTASQLLEDLRTQFPAPLFSKALSNYTEAELIHHRVMWASFQFSGKSGAPVEWEKVREAWDLLLKFRSEPRIQAFLKEHGRALVTFFREQQARADQPVSP